MSMAARFWSADTAALNAMRRLARRTGRAAAIGALLVSTAGHSSLSAQAVSASQNKARQALASAIEALGGDAWLNLRTSKIKARVAAFYQGSPTGAVAAETIRTELPDRQRIDFGGHANVVQIYADSRAWEITYKGKKTLDSKQAAEYFRWRDHSLGAVLRGWYHDPRMIVIDSGPATIGRRIADSVTLIDSADDAVTLAVDAETHLPLRLSFEWRDPEFHDRNVDAVEYANYHGTGGINTPFNITRTHNGQTVSQLYVESAQYNVAFPAEEFDPDRAAARLR